MSSTSATQSQREASCSGFHFQWLAMEMGVIFNSLFYPTSTAPFLPALVFFSTWLVKSSVKGIGFFRCL